MRLDIELNFHLFTDGWGAVSDSPVGAIDGGLALPARADGATPLDLTQKADGEGYWFGGIQNSQITGDGELIVAGLLPLGAGEGHCRVDRGIEKVFILKVFVTFLVAGIDGLYLNRGHCFRVFWALFVEMNFASEISEIAWDFVYKMADFERNPGVHSVYFVDNRFGAEGGETGAGQCDGGDDWFIHSWKLLPFVEIARVRRKFS